MVTTMKRVLTAVIMVALAGPAFADPLDDALAAAGGTLCFTRSYDSAWLKAHPGQTVRNVRFAVTRHATGDWRVLRMSIHGAGKPVYLFGECNWYSGDLNRGVQDNILDPSFSATTGVGCMLYTDVTAGSAEEGGDFAVEWGGGRYIQVHLPESVAAWRSYDVSGYARFVPVRRADRIMRLNSAPPSACRELVTRFAPGQPL